MKPPKADKIEAPAVPLKWIAVLSPEGRLTGKIQVPETAEGIDPGDLVTNGTYKWDSVNLTWVPLGHGYGKIKNVLAPHTMEIVIAAMIEKMGEDAPQEAVEWLAWYNSEIRKREQELSIAHKLRS